MARIIYGALVTSIHGKVGGTVFQKNAHGFSIKNTPTMVHPNTAPQNLVKQAVSRASQRWRNLTPTQRLNWINYAIAYPQFAKYNVSALLAGYSVFLKRNIIAEITGNYKLDSPTAVSTTNSSYTIAIHNAGGGVLNFTFTPVPVPSNLLLAIFVSSPVSPSAIVKHSACLFMDTSPAENGIFDFAPEYLGLFLRLPVAGQKVKVRIVTFGQTTGAVFADQLFDIIVT